jgi:myo-inositol 2-dehydrogenase/D-chiro-inositol 1-dehydrogenase
MKNNKLGRRDFIKKSSAATLAFTIVPRHVLGGEGYTPPSDQLTKGIVGVGSMGRNHFNYEGTRLLAVCDVDKKHLDQAVAAAGGNIDGYHDFRELLDRADIDIVHIATPPHWHAIISKMAAEAGKDIWCEKPMTRTIGEGIKVVEAVQEHGRMFRLNTWFRFKDQFYGLGTTVKPLKKLIKNGILGWPLKFTVLAWSGSI